MKKIDIQKIAKSFTLTLKKHSPAILTGIGVAGMVASTITAVRATPKALKLIEERKIALDVDKLTVGETIRTTWKCYIPSAVTGTLSAGCIVFASSVNHKRNTALATAYSLSETALKDYKDSVIKTVGEKKAEEIDKDVSKKQLERTPLVNKEVITVDRDGDLWFDPISKRYFRSTRNDVDRAVNELNRSMINEGYASLNDFYYALGLDGVGYGDDLGWNVNKDWLEISRGYTDTDADGHPCNVLKYAVAPEYGYDHF